MVCCSKYTGKARLDGKTAIVTGSNTGIGKFTVLDFVKRGARVIMACRDAGRAETAAKEIRDLTQNVEGAGTVEVVSLNLGSLASVRQCAEEILNKVDNIHILVNNADGTIKFDDMNMEKSYSATGSYNRSKLANVLFSHELATRLQGTGVTTYSLHPGVVNTDLKRHMDDSFFRGAEFIIKGFGALFFKTPEEGAQTSIYCAVDEKLADKTGLYYSDCKEKRVPAKARDPETAKRLWEVSAEMVGLGSWDPFTAADGALPPTTA
ncbi:retinol dehydrogenase 14-like isoform X3 [Periplaneta americana]|uniref:retinol dehydrogenase 14-like isoform X3 n=1 Tax=Periplaneta americana TaxID=6978 RepID=UPI0037E9C28C